MGSYLSDGHTHSIKTLSNAPPVHVDGDLQRLQRSPQSSCGELRALIGVPNLTPILVECGG